jgi:hypothetical protein
VAMTLGPLLAVTTHPAATPAAVRPALMQLGPDEKAIAACCLDHRYMRGHSHLDVGVLKPRPFPERGTPCGYPATDRGVSQLP